MIEEFLAWLGQTPWSVALLESLYVWPFLESTHVLTLALFMGTAAVNDLRLMGSGYTRIPAGEVRASQNARKHGLYTAEAIACRRDITTLICRMKGLAEKVEEE